MLRNRTLLLVFDAILLARCNPRALRVVSSFLQHVSTSVPSRPPDILPPVLLCLDGGSLPHCRTTIGCSDRGGFRSPFCWRSVTSAAHTSATRRLAATCCVQLHPMLRIKSPAIGHSVPLLSTVPTLQAPARQPAVEYGFRCGRPSKKKKKNCCCPVKRSCSRSISRADGTKVCARLEAPFRRCPRSCRGESSSPISVPGKNCRFRGGLQQPARTKIHASDCRTIRRIIFCAHTPRECALKLWQLGICQAEGIVFLPSQVPRCPAEHTTTNKRCAAVACTRTYSYACRQFSREKFCTFRTCVIMPSGAHLQLARRSPSAEPLFSLSSTSYHARTRHDEGCQHLARRPRPRRPTHPRTGGWRSPDQECVFPSCSVNH